MAFRLESSAGRRSSIVLQDFPDPDAISSAFAHRIVSAQFNIEAGTVYGGRISHQQNIALVKLLGIELVHHDELLDLDLWNYIH
jgi:nanoRNase/pAp phosphatase (c-di-AMP/oligoRNAs hydrolase)